MCRSPSVPEPLLGNESSVGRGTVSCGIFAASAAAAVPVSAFAICWANCWPMAVKSLELESFEKRLCDESGAWPFPCRLFEADRGRWLVLFLFPFGSGEVRFLL